MGSLKSFAIAAGALSLAACVAADPPAATVATPPTARANAAPDGWAHEGSDLVADPNIRFGTLANGMKYAIVKNATPPGEASIRLAIDAGSLNERDDQRGIAHFLEHMVLNGTKNVPEGEFIRRLERAGLKFGPDTNASTGFDQTVYMLDLPETDAETIDTAMFLLREVAGEATLDTAAIDSERGIILSEERTRATPQMRIVTDELAYLLKGDPLPNRLPIGTTEVISGAPRERFVEYYEGYYRPERATLIAAGDFDVDAMEAKIRDQFGNWQGKGAAAPDVAAANLGERDTEAKVFVEPGGATRVSLTWVGPADMRADTKARRAERTVEQLGLQIISRRMERLATSPTPPFIAAAALRSEQAGRAELVQIIGIAPPDGWRKTLAAVEQEQRRAVQHGFTQAELDREISEYRTALTAAAAGAATRSSAGLAQRVVGAVNEEDVVTTPADDLALFEEAVRGLTADRVAAATRSLFDGEGPLVYMTSPTAVETGDQALLAAYQGSHATAVTAPEVQQAKSWPYESFGAPGAVTERRELAGLGATAVRFANGVRLTVKPTTFKDDEILVSVRFGGGGLEEPRDRASIGWALDGGFSGGGLGKLTLEELQQVLSGTVYGLNIGIGEDAFQLGGQTRPADLARQMQVFAAFVTDAAWRPTGWDRSRALAATIHDQLKSTPGGVYGREAGALLHSGDKRWAIPSRAEMEASSIADAKAVIAPALATGPMEVIIVGDVTVDQAIAQTAASLGALPARRSANVDPAARQVRFPAPGLVRLTHEGRADQGLAFIGWPTADFYADQRSTRTLNVLSQVLQLRLIDEIREKQGTTYSPNAAHSPSEAYAGYGYMSARIEAPPEKLDGFLADAAKIAADLAATPVSADELQRARRPLVENIQRQRAGNNWWLGQLEGVQTKPEVAESIRVALDQYQAITPAELQAAARQYLVAGKAWKLLIAPAAGAAP